MKKLSPVPFEPITEEQIAKMTPQEQRIMIAKEAMAAISTQRFTPESGCYLYLPDVVDETIQRDDQLGKLLASGQGPCTGCAMGALFVAIVMKFNDVKIKDAFFVTHDVGGTGIGADRMCKVLTRFFSEKEYRIIEACFEKSISRSVRDISSYEELDSINKWVENFLDFRDRDRLIVILKNIVRNNGTFQPSDLQEA